MRQETVRVVFDNRPYLVVMREDGSLDRAFGPFDPGTEPNLAEGDDTSAVTSQALLAELEQLLPVSPSLPASRNTLAGG
jgi:hypothetical protein